MDKAVFVKKLRNLFLNLNNNDKRYSKVWLSDADFGGLYHSGKYILKLKAEHQIDSYRSEIIYIFDLLDKTLDKEESSYIFNLEVFYENEYASPDRDDIIIYNDEVSYNAA
jgi:hypothetical protein